MTSRPVPGAQDPAFTPLRRAPSHYGQEPVADTDGRPKAATAQHDGLQTTALDSVRTLPKGRPQLFFSDTAENNLDIAEPSPTAVALLPVPPRPSLSIPAEALQQRRLVPGGSGVKSDPALLKSAQHDNLPCAAILPGGKAADLFLWTGGHPEDVLSEALVRSGIANKGHNANETNTARPSLWANLKNKSGTSTLSTLFVAVLEKRQSCSRLTAPNTFKPPPRLTLRDSTRETWLHDLANPAVGLRRLSRTIPHGITGKVLLEQCLNKGIPIPRALWLAKCVGINEMRAHKRKGQAGTITWVRGWTSSVEQFLDSVIACIGQQDWKSRITYALQLAAHLYKEHLVEEGHFMDWILNSLDTSSSERLFLWLLITCIPDFWANIISSRRRGKRLAQSLLAHAEKVYALDAEARKASVLSLLESMITRIALSKPACLLLPDQWEKYNHIMQTLARGRPHTEFSNAIADLDERNRKVMRRSSSGCSTSQRSLRMLYDLLDNLEYQSTIFVDSLAFHCMDLIPDRDQLISAVLGWSSSLYRQGLHRAYLVTRLLRKWHQMGIDICEGIINYLPQMASDSSKEPRIVFRIIAELVRSKTFLLGRYLQWLIATGSMDTAQNIHSASAWQTRLLTEVPLSGLSPEVINLRGTILRGSSYSVDVEQALIIRMKHTILQRLTDPPCPQFAFDDRMNTDSEHSSRTISLEVARWLRRQVVSMSEPAEGALNKHDNALATSSICSISLAHFEIVRSYLEEFEDLAILADVIGIVASSYDSHVLSALSDTLCYHIKAFRVIGAFDSLLERITSRYTAVRALRIPEKDLLLSLGALFQLAHADPQIMQLLDYDLGRYDHRSSIAACSPVSDTMIESITQSDSEDDIERILSSGNNMDRPTMHRVLSKIITHIEERMCPGDDPTEHLSAWIGRLHSFGERTFQTVISSWLGSVLVNHEERILSVVLPSLIASGCFTFAHFLDTLQSCVRRLEPDHPAESLRIALKGLEQLLPNGEMHDAQRRHAYQFRTQQALFCSKQNNGLLDLIKQIFELSVAVPVVLSHDELMDRLLDNRLLDVLKHFAVIDTASVHFLLESPGRCSDGKPNVYVTTVLDRIMDPLNALNLSNLPYAKQATTIFQVVDQLSLPFCQLKLRDLFNSFQTVETSIESLPAAFINHLKLAPETDHAYLLEVATGMDASFMQLTRECAEEEILNSSAFLCDPVSTDGDVNLPHCIPRLLELSCAANAECTEESQPVLVAIVERLRGITEAIHRIERRPGDVNDASSHGEVSLVSGLCSWLNILLRLVVYRTPGLVSKASHQHQTALMWNLRNLFTGSHMEAFPSTTRYIFDVAVLISDHISEDVRKSFISPTCVKCCRDSRCAFIFGPGTEHDGWLGLTKSVSQTANTQTPSSSQGQTASAAQPQTQNYSAGAPTSQRASNQQQQQSQQQGRTFAYPQHQQSHKLLSQQLQRLGSNGQNNQVSQMQQMQQMQAMAQQRQVPSIGGQLHRVPPSSQMSPSTTAKNSSGRHDRKDVKPTPYNLSRWEILPESGGNVGGNETAISLTLFGARRA